MQNASCWMTRYLIIRRVSQMKKIGLKLVFILVLTLSAAFFTALMLKAAIGTYACWDALSVNISQITGLKVANFSIIMNVSCVFLQFLILRKDFQASKLLQIPFAILFGTLVNFFYYNILVFNAHSYAFRFVLCVLSVVGVAFFLGFLTSLNLVNISVETTCNIISGKFAVDYALLRVGIDVICIALSIALSFFFDLSFTIREGTLIAMALLGPLEKQFMKIFLPVSEKLAKI